MMADDDDPSTVRVQVDVAQAAEHAADMVRQSSDLVAPGDSPKRANHAYFRADAAISSGTSVPMT